MYVSVHFFFYFFYIEYVESKTYGDGMKYQEKKEALVEHLGLPRDLLLGSVILTVTGQKEACIENYRGIIEYTPAHIRLQTKTCQLIIGGQNLCIDYYSSEEMKITGTICEIKYC